MTPNDVLDMDYAEFYERTMHHKALVMRRPWWNVDEGHDVWMLENTTGQRAPKPQR